MPRRVTLPKAIRDSVIGIFAKHKLPAPYILFRTSTLVNFVNESPHNLLPRQRKPESRRGWTVYFKFETPLPEIDGLEKIIAFPDKREAELPRQIHVGLGKDKKPGLVKADQSK